MTPTSSNIYTYLVSFLCFIILFSCSGKFLHLETPQRIPIRSQQKMFKVPNESADDAVFAFASRDTTIELRIAELRATYDRDYVHGDRATRHRYAQAYATMACANPHRLPVPMFSNESDPCEVPHPKYW